MIICFILPITFIFGNGESSDIKFEKVIDSLKTLRNKSPERAIRYAREILDNHGSNDLGHNESRILNTVGEIYLELSLPTLALSYFIDANEKSVVKGKKPWISINIGNVYFQEKVWLKAKEKYLDALDAFRRRNVNHPNALSGKAKALSNLAKIEMNLNNHDQALKYFKEALDLKRNSARYQAFQKTKLDAKPAYVGIGAGVAKQHHLLSILYTRWGLYELALEQCSAIDSLMSYLNGKEDVNYDTSLILGKNYSRRCELFTILGEYQKALTNSRSAIVLLKNSPIELVKHYKIDAEMYIAQNDLYKALESIDTGLKVCDFNGMSIQELDLLDKKMKILKSNKLERSALGISQKIIVKKEQVENKRTEILLESLSYRSELLKNRKEISASENRQKMTLVISFAIIVMLGFIVKYYRNKREYLEQQVKLNEQEKQIVASELKKKENDLIKMSTFIVSKNDLLSSIVKDLEYHISLIDNKSDRKSLEPLKKRISNKIDDSADWDQFLTQFSTAYPDFIDCLTEKYPKLRSGDIKLCCYLKMNMNTKEIAKVSGLSVRAVENKRYRLRKKLELETDVSLDSYIHSMRNK